VSCDVIEKEKEIYSEQSKGKPEHAITKIIDGKLEKFFSQFCLLQQTFIKDSKISVNEYLMSKVAKLGENIKIRRFTRYQLGG